MNQGDQLLQQMQQLQTQMQQMLQQMLQQLQQTQQTQAEVLQLQTQMQAVNVRFDVLETMSEARDKNGQARLINSSVSRRDTHLLPLVDSNNHAVPNFPDNLEALLSLRNDQVRALLNSFGLDTTGSGTDMRRRFRQFVGVVIDIA